MRTFSEKKCIVGKKKEGECKQRGSKRRGGHRREREMKRGTMRRKEEEEYLHKIYNADWWKILWVFFTEETKTHQHYVEMKIIHFTIHRELMQWCKWQRAMGGIIP